MALLDPGDAQDSAELTDLVGLLAASDREEHRTLLLVLRCETRLDGHTAEFRAAVAAAWVEPSVGDKNASRACTCLTSASAGLRRRLPGDAAAATLRCAVWRTVVPAQSLISKGMVTGDVRSPSDLPPRVSLVRPVGLGSDGASHDVWVSDFENPDADETRDRLGLCHIGDGQVLYRVSLPMEQGRPVWIPTALDGCGFAAFHPPPAETDLPWGLTRDLRTDDPAEPELITTPWLPRDDAFRTADRIGTCRRAADKTYLARRHER